MYRDADVIKTQMRQLEGALSRDSNSAVQEQELKRQQQEMRLREEAQRREVRFLLVPSAPGRTVASKAFFLKQCTKQLGSAHRPCPWSRSVRPKQSSDRMSSAVAVVRSLQCRSRWPP